VKPPEYWADQVQNYQVFVMDLNSDISISISQNLLRTLPRTRVTNIWRIQNLKLWRWYFLYRQEIGERHPHRDSNERLVWHGTDINNIDDIVQIGFDFRLARQGAIGSGIYFAASALTSHGYVRNGNRMLLCRLAIGQTTPGHVQLRRPPPLDNNGNLYDSVCGQLSGDEIYCVFDNRQAYPEWVIEYV